MKRTIQALKRLEAEREELLQRAKEAKTGDQLELMVRARAGDAQARFELDAMIAQGGMAGKLDELWLAIAPGFEAEETGEEEVQ